jgi:hypothetical protein
MKNLFSLSILIAVVSILLSSCNSNYSITKRRYNKGYYVHHTSNKHSEVKSNETKVAKNVAKSTEDKIYVMPSAGEIAPPASRVEEPTSLTAQSTKKATKINDSRSGGKFELPAELSIKNQVKAIKSLAKRASADASDEALSLLWIIVVVILILWAIGFLLEIGGPAIHVLAVIALVLLILWLLKII